MSEQRLSRGTRGPSQFQSRFQFCFQLPSLGLGLAASLGAGLGAAGWMGDPALALNPVQGKPGELSQSQPGLRIAASSAELAGYDFLTKGWIDDAIAAFETALTETPNSLTVRRGLAMAYQRAGRDEAAWQAYGAVLELDQDDETALRARGEMGVYRPEWQRSGIAALDRFLTLQPGAAAQRAQRALLLGYQQDFAAAIADYDLLLADDNAAALPPALLPNLWVNAAQIYTYGDRVATALALFERHRQAGGQLDDSATLAYGAALRQSGQAAAAIALLEPFSPADAGQAFEGRLSLALAHGENSDPERARAVLRPLLDPLPQDLVQRRAIAAALLPLEPTPELLPAIEALLLDPEPDPFLRFRAAQIQLQQENWAAARANLLAYQAATPELDIGTEFLLAELDRQAGDLEASGDRYASLTTQAPQEAQQLDALRGLAAIRFEQQRLDEAEQLYRQLIARRSDDLNGRQTFAELLAAQDKPKQALAQFAAAQALALKSAAAADTASPDTAISLLVRQRQIRRSFLRRRGFQPRWERY